MVDIFIGLIIYFVGAIITFFYAFSRGIVWNESLLVATLSWVGLFFLWFTDN